MFDHAERRRRLSAECAPRRRPALPRALVRPRVPLRRRARDPVLRAELVPARLGRGRLLPARRRPGLRAAAHGRRVRPAGAARRARSSSWTRPTTGARSSSASLEASAGRRPSRSATVSGPRRRSSSAASSVSSGSRTGSALVNRLRRVKTAEELDAMGRACRTVEAAMTAVDAARRAGRDDGRAPRGGRGAAPAAGLADAVLRDPRLHRDGFATASTPGPPTRATPLADGTAVLFDFGGVVDGYCSDFGRTVVAGEPPPGFRRGLRRDARRV